MKIVVDRGNFQKNLGIVTLAQGTGQQNEWTKGIKIEANKELIGENKIRLSATDTMIGINVDVDATVDVDGACLIDGGCIGSLVNKFVEGQLELNVMPDKVEIKCGRDTGEYSLMKVDDFSDINIDTSNSGWFTLPVEVIERADTKVRWAAAQISNARPRMMSVYFVVKDKIMDIVACDGLKLAKYTIPAEDNIPEIAMLLPGPSLQKIYKTIKEKGVTETISLNIQADKVYFSADGLRISASLVDGNYINYKKIIPESYLFAISFDRKELIRKVEIAKIANKYAADSGKSYHIGVRMTDEGFGQGFCTIVNSKSSANKQVGEIPFSQEEGQVPNGFCLWVEPDFIMEALSNVDGDIVRLDIVNETTPFKMKTKGADDKWLALVMPRTQKKNEG